MCLITSKCVNFPDVPWFWAFDLKGPFNEWVGFLEELKIVTNYLSYTANKPPSDVAPSEQQQLQPLLIKKLMVGFLMSFIHGFKKNCISDPRLPLKKTQSWHQTSDPGPLVGQHLFTGRVHLPGVTAETLRKLTAKRKGPKNCRNSKIPGEFLLNMTMFGVSLC